MATATPVDVSATDRFTFKMGPVIITRENDGKVFYADEGRQWPGLDYGDMTALNAAITFGVANAVFGLGIEESKKKGKWTDTHEKVIGALKK